MFGYSRQAYHQHFITNQVNLFNDQIIAEQVKVIRSLQKNCGGKKLYLMLQPFFQKHHLKIGRDALFNILRRQGLLIRKRKRKPVTTDSNHPFRKYPNLTVDLVLNKAHQVWVSDITYIPVASEYAYLNLVTDAYSRKIIGFYLSEDMTARSCCQALKMAINQKPPQAATIHHSDRGLQYCSDIYTTMLLNNKMLISMTENSDPYENAIAERVNGILKAEFFPDMFSDVVTARRAVARAVLTYNHHRLHASLDMMTPDQAHTQKGELRKHWKSRYAGKEELLK